MTEQFNQNKLSKPKSKVKDELASSKICSEPVNDFAVDLTSRMKEFCLRFEDPRHPLHQLVRLNKSITQQTKI